MLTRFKEKRPT